MAFGELLALKLILLYLSELMGGALTVVCSVVAVNHNLVLYVEMYCLHVVYWGGGASLQKWGKKRLY